MQGDIGKVSQGRTRDDRGMEDDMGAFFQIIVVSFNAGDNLNKTIASIKEQTFDSWNVIIKDGLSTDGSIDKLKEELEINKETGRSKDEKFLLISEKDAGIYDAMNTALNVLSGSDTDSYVYFLNCGDFFKDKDTLEKIHDGIIQSAPDKEIKHIFYGDIYERMTGQVVSSNPKMDDFALYRNVPCHQTCFYDMKLMMAEHFDTTWHIRGDYEHFLRCVYIDKAQTVYIPVTVADYEGGGYSESGNARVVSERERKQIVERYMPKGKVFKYDLIRMLTLAPLRTFIAHNPKTAGAYNKIKSLIYNRKKGN